MPIALCKNNNLYYIVSNINVCYVMCNDLSIPLFLFVKTAQVILN